MTRSVAVPRLQHHDGVLPLRRTRMRGRTLAALDGGAGEIYACSVATGRLQNVRVAIVVLGDIARSPRMRHHATAMAAEGATVDLIGYVENDFPAALARHPRIHVRELPAHRSSGSERSSSLAYISRGVVRSWRLAWSLLRALGGVPSLDLVLIQNPPIFPTAAIAFTVARCRGARVVIDWHNLSFAMLALRVGREHPIAELSRQWEGRIGSMADGHLCVSRAMSEVLRDSWDVNAAVLYDRPPKMIETADATTREDFLRRVWSVENARDCPVVVTATSWTDDEDADMLLAAACEVDRRLEADSAAHRFLFIASGDGPNRAAFERNVERCDLKRVAILTGWLSPDDYDTMLACADLGVSLHRSASGIDLPMKIADMRGAALPVAALDYGPVLREILDPGVDGLLFSDSVDLARIIERLIVDRDGDELQLLGRTVRERFVATWRDGWTMEALPTIESLTT